MKGGFSTEDSQILRRVFRKETGRRVQSPVV